MTRARCVPDALGELQAPAWMQRRGLEWLYRLSQDPVRLAPRYLRYNPWFVAGFLRQYLRHLRRRPA